MEQYGEGINILAFEADRFNETYLQFTDVKMVGETCLEIAACPRPGMAFILHARGQHCGVTSNGCCDIRIAPIDPADA